MNTDFRSEKQAIFSYFFYLVLVRLEFEIAETEQIILRTNIGSLISEAKFCKIIDQFGKDPLFYIDISCGKCIVSNMYIIIYVYIIGVARNFVRVGRGLHQYVL